MPPQKISSSASSRRRQMGVWLSLCPPGSHACPFCHKNFKSKQAMGGHQNAHRIQRIQMQVNKMCMKITKEEKRKQVREGNGIHSSRCNIAAPVANDDSDIDLELGLSSGPSKKAKDFCKFLSIEKVKGYGVGAHSGFGVDKTCAEAHPYVSPAASGQPLMVRELVEMPLRAGGVGSDYFLKASGANDVPGANQHVTFLCGGRGTPKVSSKSGLDLTLKL